MKAGEACSAVAVVFIGLLLASPVALARPAPGEYEFRRATNYIRMTGRPESWSDFSRRAAGLRGKGRSAEARAMLENRFGPASGYSPTHLLIKYKSGVTRGRALGNMARRGLGAEKRYGRVGIDRARITSGRDVIGAIMELLDDPDIEYVEPDFILRGAIVPNDSYYPQQWAMTDIGVETVWNTDTGSRDVVVGVIDSGGDQNHPDLVANYWTDSTGKTGWNAIAENNNPEDDHGHGTHVAGTVGAVGNNELGVAGVNWQTTIINLKFLNSENSGFTSDAIECMEWVLARKAEGVNIRVTNNSWGSYSENAYSQSCYDAIKDLMDAGILFVAAAGNDGGDVDKDTPHYPSNYDLPNIISVLNYGSNGQKHSSTNYGWQKVHIGAPGQAIWSTYIGDTYTTMTGTSMSTPHVTGALALLFATDTDMDWRVAKDRLLATTTETATMDSLVQTAGKLNLVKLMANDSRSIFQAMLPIDEETSVINLPITLRACWYGPNRPAEIAAAITQTGGNTNRTLKDDGVSPDIAANDGIFSAAWTPSVNDSFIITYTANAQNRSLRGNLSGGNTWYLNDTSTVGDLWCTEIGYDTADGQSPGTPMRNWSALQSLITHGDTVLIDSGYYYPTAISFISFDNVTVRGVDSSSTFLIYDSDAAGAQRCLYAAQRNGVSISDLRVVGGYYGIYLNNTDSSSIRRCRSDSNGYAGFYLKSGADSNVIANCDARGNGSYGFSIYQDSGNLIQDNSAAGNLSYGFNIYGSERCTFTGNTALVNTTGGFLLSNSSLNNTFSQNIADSNGSYGFRIGTSNGNAFSNCTASRHGSYGFVLVSGGDTNQLNGCVAETASMGFRFEGAHGNTVTGGITRGNSNYGVYMYNGATGNTLRGLAVTGNSNFGMYLNAAVANTIEYCTSSGNLRGLQLEASSTRNLVRGNWLRSNSQQGLMFSSSADTNTILGNFIGGNTSYGVYISGSSHNNFGQNTLDNDGNYEIFLTGTCLADTFDRNNILPAPLRPDSGVNNTTANSFAFIRNWWGSMDSSAVENRRNGTGASLLTYSPYRLGMVDTATNADTVAPAAPDTVVVAETTASTARLTWAVVTLNEDGSAVDGLGGYRIYRSQIRDTTLWVARGTVGAATTTFTDSGLTADTRYYYRITAYDTWTPWPNESFYSDSIASCTTAYYSGPIWYVANDTGSDAGAGDTASPFKTIARALTVAASGETVQVYAGTYTESVAITKDTIAILGAGIGLTNIEAGVSDHSCSATNRIGLILRDFSCTGPASTTMDGLYFIGCTGAAVTRVGVHNRRYGVYISGCAACVVSNCVIDSNANHQVYDPGSGGRDNLFDSNLISNGLTYGIYTLSDSSIYTNNRLLNNQFYGFYLWFADSNTITGNQVQNCWGGALAHGLHLKDCYGNLIDSNIFDSCAGIGVRFNEDARMNRFTNNRVTANAQEGLRFDTASNNYVGQNYLTGNTMTQISLAGNSNADTIDRNNIISALSYMVNNSTGGNHIMARRNWWGTADSNVIAGLIAGTAMDSVDYGAWRLGEVDTAAGADSIAPAAPDTLVISETTYSTAKMSWAVSSVNEDGTALTDLAGYRIYRSQRPDTTLWVACGTVTAPTTTFTDSNLTAESGYYYRVTAYDNHANWPNESFYSDSIASCTPAMPAYSGPIWYVAVDTGSDTAAGNGSETYPWRSINRGILTASSGETVQVYAGTYAESVQITKDTIAILGAGMGQTFIEPETTTYTCTASNRIGLILRDFTCTGAFYCHAGVRFTAVVNSEITRVGVHNQSRGVWLENGCTGCVVANCDLDSNGRGVAIITSSDVIVDSNLVTRSVEYGIVCGGDSNRISNNRIDSSATTGIYLGGGDSNTVSGNWIHHCRSTTSGPAIEILSAFGNLIHNNTLDSNAYYQVSVTGATSLNNVIDSNRIVNGGNISIYMTSDSNSITNNRIESPRAANHAVYLRGADTPLVSGNTLYDINHLGLYLLELYGARVFNNTVDSVLYSGIAVLDTASHNTVDSNLVKNCLLDGITVTGDWNTVTANVCRDNRRIGIALGGDSNTARGNFLHASGAGGDNYASGIAAYAATAAVNTGNTIESNVIDGSFGPGILVRTAALTSIRSNRIISGASIGIRLDTAVNCTIEQNDISGNADSAIHLAWTSTADTVTRNNLNEGVTNATAATFDFTRNWWGLTDTERLAGRITNTGGGVVAWSPFRLREIDTVAGADTIAPLAPDSVSAVSYSGGCTVVWDTVSQNENGFICFDRGGYHIFRSLTADTSDWGTPLATVDSVTTRYTDTNVTPLVTYHYRVSCFDDHAPLPNESFYSDSTCSGMPALPAYAGPIWYVAVDTGSDTAAGNGSETYPWRTIWKGIESAASGETVQVHAGTYAESVVFKQDSVALIGAGRDSTIIEPGGYTGCSATARANLKIRDLAIRGVTGTNDGIYWNGVVRSEISGCSIANCARYGINLQNGSAENLIYNNRLDSNTSNQIYMEDNATTDNTIDSNLVNGGGGVGIHLHQADSNLISNNRVLASTTIGINLSNNADTNRITGNYLYDCRSAGVSVQGSRSNLFDNNHFDSNKHDVYFSDALTGNSVDSNRFTGGGGIRFESSSDSNTITNNRLESTKGGVTLDDSDTTTVSGNTLTNITGSGVSLRIARQGRFSENTIDSCSSQLITASDFSNENVFDSNILKNGRSVGIQLAASSNSNAFTRNRIENCGTIGLFLDDVAANRFDSNSIVNCTGTAVVVNSANGNFLRSNLIDSAASYGITFYDAKNNLIAQNTFSRISNYAVAFQAASAADTFEKNNIIPSANKGCSNIATAGFTFDLTRNWWDTVDSAAITGYMAGTTNELNWQNWRLGEVDTIAGADSIAPLAPDSVSVAGFAGGCTLTWTAPLSNEDGTSYTDTGGFRVYASRTSDTSNWGESVAAVSGSNLSCTVGGLTPNVTWYFRVTAYDDHSGRPNESFYSDSIIAGAAHPPVYTGPVWYAAVDTGSDTAAANGSETYPWRTITKAITSMANGETVMVYNGTYAEYLDVTRDSVFIIGASRESTILSGGADIVFYLEDQYGVTIRNFKIVSATYGIQLNHAPRTTVDSVWILNPTLNAVILQQKAIEGGEIYSSFTNCRFEGGGGGGTPFQIYVAGGLNDSITWSGNEFINGTGHALYIEADYYTITNNIFDSMAGSGICYGTNHTITNNIFRNARSAANAALLLAGAGNYAANNLFDSNAGPGIRLNDATNARVEQNTIKNGGDYAIAFSAATANCTVVRNNIFPRADKGCQNSATAGSTFDISRNWWGTADSSAITGYMAGTTNELNWSDWRLGEVDTGAGEDTVAPAAPDTVVISDSNLFTSICTVTWATVTLNEDGSGCGDLAGYRVYRAQRPDTSLWVERAVTAATIFVDSGLTPETGYYYRVTAFDNHATWPNESFYSDSIASCTLALAAYNGPIWYVANDTGSDTATGNGTETYPYKSITRAMTACAAGDTIRVYAGTYAETVSITKDTISLIGSGTGLTLIVPGDSTAGAARIGIFADTQSGLIIRDLGIRTAYRGIGLQGVTQSVVDSIVLTDIGDRALYLLNRADTNTISNVTATNELQIAGSHGNRIETCVMVGFRLTGGSRKNTLIGNTAPAGTATGISLSDAHENQLINNTCTGCSNWGFSFFGSTSNSCTGNLASGGGDIGFYIWSNSNSNIFVSNISENNSQHGFKFSESNDNTCSGNISRNNIGGGNGMGFYLSTSSTGNLLIANRAEGNPADGFYITGNSDGNTLIGNTSYNNLTGFGLLSSKNNFLAQNTADSNAGWAVRLEVSSTADTFSRNNFIPSSAKPESGVWNATAANLDFTRQWWGTRNRDRIAAMMTNTGGGSIDSGSWRLAIVDTGSGQDTIAPASPASLTCTGFAGGCTLTWTAPGANEDGSALGDLAGYHLYRSLESDTPDWGDSIATIAAGTQVWVDTTIVLTDTYYYRVTAYDNHAVCPNESFYSDSIASAADSTRFTLIAIGLASTASDYIWPDTPLAVSATIADTIWYNPIGAGAAQIDTLTIHISGSTESQVTGSNIFTAIQIIDSGLNKDSYLIVYQIETNAASANCQIVAWSSTGQTDTALIRFEADTQPPTTPTLAAPIADTNLSTVVFRWTASVETGAGLRKYQLQIDTAGTFSACLVDSAVGVMLYDTRTLAPNDTYYWRVVAWDSVSNSSATAAQSFIIDTIGPTTPTGLAPANTDTSATSIVFSWNAAVDTVSGIHHYQIQFDTYNLFDTCVIDSSVGTFTFDTRTLPANETYYWRVVVHDSAGNAAAAAGQMLRIDTGGPGAFSLAAPPNPTDTTATSFILAWNASTGSLSTVTYRLQADTAGTFAAPILDSAGLSTTAETVALPANDSYWWRVIARDSAGNQRYSAETWVVRIDTAGPTAFSLGAPANGADTSATTLILAWSASADSISTITYRLQVDTAGDFASPIVDSYWITTSSETVSIPGNDTYYWRVIARDSAGNQRYSTDTYFFRVDTAGPTAFSLLAPADLTETNATSIRLSWSAALDSMSAVTYRAQVDTAGTFAGALVVDSYWLSNTGETVTLAANDTYHWRVWARDSAGNQRQSTETRVLVIDTAPPVLGSIEIVTSAAGYFDTAGGIDAAAAADTVWFNNTGAGVGQTETVTVTASGAYGILFASGFGRDAWLDTSTPYLCTYTIAAGVTSDTATTLTAVDTAGNTVVLTINWGRDVTPPPATGLTSPAAGVTLGETQPTFVWGASTDTQSGTRIYRFQIATDIGFTSVVQDSHFPPGTLSTTASNLPSDTYWWRVIPSDSVANIDTAGAEKRLLYIDTGVPVITAITIACTAADYFYAPSLNPHLPLDTVWYNPIGAGARQFDSVSVWVSDSNMWNVRGNAIFTPVVVSDTGSNKAPYQISYIIPSGAASQTLVIVATDSGGFQDTANIRFAADTQAPTTPSLTYPAANHDTRATELVLVWTESTDTGAGLRKYQLQIDTSGSFTNCFVDSAVIGRVYDTHALPANETWYWRVVAWDSVANTAVSDSRRFVIDTTPPTTPSLLTPAADTILGSCGIAFTWTASTDTLSGILHYQLQIDTCNLFDTCVIDSSVGIVTAETRALAANDTYYWRIIAVDSAGCTAAATSRRFSIDTAPPTGLALSSPAANAETTSTGIVFAWTAATDAISGLKQYRLQVDTDASFGAPRIDSTLGASILFDTHTLPANETWYWRVSATDTVGNETWTASRTVAIDTRLAVSLSAPADSATQDTRPVFSWTGTAVDTYWWQLSTAASFATIHDSVIVASGITAYQPALVESGTYYWRVAAWNDFGGRETTTARYLIVDTGSNDTTPPNPFDIVSPADGVETSATRVLYKWNLATDSHSGIASHTLQFAKATSFAILYDSRVCGGAVSETSVGLVGCDTYYWRVLATDNAGCTRVSTSYRRIVIDTQPPTRPGLLSPIGGGETTVTAILFKWSASLDTFSGVKDYRLQVSRADTTFATTVVDLYHAGSAETTPLYLFSATDTFYWRMYARDNAGETSGWTSNDSFRRPALTDSTPPASAKILTITANAGATITLSWLRSPSSGMDGGGQYNVYWDNGTGEVGCTTPIAIIAHTADTIYTWTTGILTDSRYYSFIVRAQDSRGIENTDTAKVTALAGAVASGMPMAVIMQSQCGNRLLSVQALLSAEISPSSSLSLVKHVLFQYRADTAEVNAPWDTMQTLTALRPNPATNAVGGQYTMHWDLNGTRAGNDTVPDGLYQLRAVAHLTDGRWDSAAKILTVQVVSGNQDRTDTQLASGDYYAEERVYGGTENRLYAASDSSTAGVTMPENAVPGASDTLLMTLAATSANGSPASRSIVTGALTLTLGSGQSALGGAITVWLSYTDANDDGIVDGTSIRVADLELWHYTGGAWAKCATTRVDTALKRIYGATTGFSEFAGTGPAAASSLDGFMVAPNPFRPNDGNAATGAAYQRDVAATGIWFLNLPNAVLIEIYTINGQKVVSFSTSNSGGSVQWDARNDRNREVASGYYFYIVTDLATSRRVTGKLVVIR